MSRARPLQQQVHGGMEAGGLIFTPLGMRAAKQPISQCLEVWQFRGRCISDALGPAGAWHPVPLPERSHVEVQTQHGTAQVNPPGTPRPQNLKPSRDFKGKWQERHALTCWPFGLSPTAISEWEEQRKSLFYLVSIQGLPMPIFVLAYEVPTTGLSHWKLPGALQATIACWQVEDKGSLLKEKVARVPEWNLGDTPDSGKTLWCPGLNFLLCEMGHGGAFGMLCPSLNAEHLANNFLLVTSFSQALE